MSEPEGRLDPYVYDMDPAEIRAIDAEEADIAWWDAHPISPFKGASPTPEERARYEREMEQNRREWAEWVKVHPEP